jgi:nucleoside-diphosphate-sugar epimerase
MATRTVITGASGNVGTALLRRLASAGGDYEVVGIARRRPPHTGIYRSADWHQLDIADPDAAARLCKVFDGADCVVHLAWGFQPTRNTSYLDAVGIGGSRAVLDAAHAARVGQLIHMSSIGAYAAGRYGQRVDESWPATGIPTSAYSRAKAAAEAMLDDYELDHVDRIVITRMRPGFILQRRAAAGLRRYMLPAYVRPRWLRFLPVLPLDRRLVVPVVHADDVADAFVRAIERRAPGPFNLAAEPPVRRDDLAAELGAKPVHVPSAVLRPIAQMTWRARLQPVDAGWLDMAFTVPLLNTDRARSELGWSPQYDAFDAMRDMGAGFMHDDATESPVLQRRSVLTALVRDVSIGPLTTREVP